MHQNTYLALGDSYTIGEGVSKQESFPYQTVQLLRKAGHDFMDPEIVAKTGWTSEDLINEIPKRKLASSYNFVTLLIGVNNQFQGRSVEEYSIQFENLLKQAIQFAGNNNQHVIVLSIPDWGATPFAEGRNREQIAKEINAFNKVNQSICEPYIIPYINITPGSRKALYDSTLITKDKLHPSSKEYAKWAKKISATISTVL
ncbi:MAG: SGNH/GDSL hydrolase family protein [Bacteroidota bacterium]|nr:SGNH/GDSL hydrolase family protein [Bacteroidota bacterium]